MSPTRRCQILLVNLINTSRRLQITQRQPRIRHRRTLTRLGTEAIHKMAARDRSSQRMTLATHRPMPRPTQGGIQRTILNQAERS